MGAISRAVVLTHERKSTSLYCVDSIFSFFVYTRVGKATPLQSWLQTDVLLFIMISAIRFRHQLMYPEFG